MSSLPLTRNQIFDVVTLIGRATRDAATLLHAASLSSASSCVSSAAPNGLGGGGGGASYARGKHATGDGLNKTPSLFATSSSSSSHQQNAHHGLTSPQPQQQASSSSIPADLLIVRSGLFLDVIAHPACSSWTATEKALYLVWWAHRPQHCKACGSHDRWLPSVDDEYQCDHCSSGNGSTRTNEVVEDMPNLNENDGDTSQDENDGPLSGPAGRDGRSGVQALSGAALVSLFCVYLTHLNRLPLDVRPPSSVYPMTLRMATELAELVPLPSSGEAQLSGKGGGYEALSSGSAADEEEHPGTLIRTASLFIACCVVCPGLVPFPLFMRQAPARSALITAAASQTVLSNGSVTDNNIHNMMMNTGNADAYNSNSNNASYAISSTSPSKAGAFACQWMDVAALAANIGLVLDDFFDSEGTVRAFLTNVMVMIKNYVPTSLAWSPDRDAARMPYITGVLMARRNGTRQHSKPASGTALSAIRPKQRFSPEHTAAFVAIELVRCFQTSKEGQSCERMKSWYKKNAPLFLPNCSSEDQQQQQGNSNSSSGSNSHQNLLPTTSWGNLLLWIFSKELFGVSALELCELLMASGVYGGPTLFFEALSDRVASGYYDVPLQRRLRPYISPWTALFSALHSEDRLVLMSALHLATQRGGGGGGDAVGGGAVAMPSAAAAGGGPKEEQRVIELVQRVLRKHGSLHRYQFNYGLRVIDAAEKHLQGTFFASHISDYCAVYTCLKSGRKTISFDANTETVTLNFLGSKSRVVDFIETEFVGPVVASIEDVTTKMVFDLVRHQLHEVEWADAQRRIVARETIKRRLQSGTNPRIALTELRSILATANVPITTITAQCGMVASGEFNASAYAASTSPFSPVMSSAGAADNKNFANGLLNGGVGFAAGESMIGNSFTNVSPYTPVSTPVFNPNSSSSRNNSKSFDGLVANNSTSSSQQLNRLDYLSQQTAQRFAAAMAGGVATAGAGANNTDQQQQQEEQQHIFARYLQCRQRATLLRSIERQLLTLPAAPLVMGLPVSKQLELFAEQHALSEGPYVEPLTTSTSASTVGTHHQKSVGGKQQKGSGGGGGGRGKSPSPPEDDNASALMAAAGLGGFGGADESDKQLLSSPSPLNVPFAKEEEHLNRVVAAVTGASVMLTGGSSPLPASSGPISFADHVSSSTFRLESRFAAELQLKTAVSRYQSFRKTGSCNAAAEEAALCQRVERRKKRLQKQQQQMQQHEEQQQQQMLLATTATSAAVGDGAAPSPPNHHPSASAASATKSHHHAVDNATDSNNLTSPPQRYAAVSKERRHIRDSGVENTTTTATAEVGRDGGGGDMLPEGGMFDAMPFSPDATVGGNADGEENDNVNSKDVSHHQHTATKAASVPPSKEKKEADGSKKKSTAATTTTSKKTADKSPLVAPFSSHRTNTTTQQHCEVSEVDEEGDVIIGDDDEDDVVVGKGGLSDEQQRKKNAPPEAYLLRKQTKRAREEAGGVATTMTTIATTTTTTVVSTSSQQQQQRAPTPTARDSTSRTALTSPLVGPTVTLSDTTRRSGGSGEGNTQRQNSVALATTAVSTTSERVTTTTTAATVLISAEENDEGRRSTANGASSKRRRAEDGAAPHSTATTTTIPSATPTPTPPPPPPSAVPAAAYLTTVASASSKRREEMAKRRAEKLKNERFNDEADMY